MKEKGIEVTLQSKIGFIVQNSTLYSKKHAHKHIPITIAMLYLPQNCPRSSIRNKVYSNKFSIIHNIICSKMF